MKLNSFHTYAQFDKITSKTDRYVTFFDPYLISKNSISGKNKIGGLLGLPFYMQYKAVIIDWRNKKLYLKK